MNTVRTTTILERLPAILAVTAASYGLALQVNCASGRADAARRASHAAPYLSAGTPLKRVAAGSVGVAGDALQRKA